MTLSQWWKSSFVRLHLLPGNKHDISKPIATISMHTIYMCMQESDTENTWPRFPWRLNANHKTSIHHSASHALACQETNLVLLAQLHKLLMSCTKAIISWLTCNAAANVYNKHFKSQKSCARTTCPPGHTSSVADSSMRALNEQQWWSVWLP